MKLAGTERMQWFPACVAFTLSTKKSPTNRIWPPLGDWPLRPNYVRYRNVWYLVGKIIHRAIFSQKLKFLPWSSDALLAIKVPAGEKDPPPGFQRSKKPGAHRVKDILTLGYWPNVRRHIKLSIPPLEIPQSNLSTLRFISWMSFPVSPSLQVHSTPGLPSRLAGRLMHLQRWFNRESHSLDQ